jgi:membrane protease YdiL (CAAX protease family)
VSDLEPQSQPDRLGPPPPGQPPLVAVAVEDRPRYPFWNWVDVLVFFGLLAACFFAGALLTSAVFHALGSKLPKIQVMVVAQFVAFGLALAGLKLMFLTRYDQPLLPSLAWRVDRWLLLPSFVSGLLVAVLVALTNALLLHTKPVENEVSEMLRDPQFGPILAVFTVTVGPFFEEMFLRGFIQPLLIRTLGAAAGIAVSGFGFAALHGPQYHWAWQYVASVTIAGIAFALMRYRTGSTALAFTMHSGYNSLFAISLLMQRGGF